MNCTRKVKIIATVGPSCSDVAILARLVDAGVNVFRMNFSHGSHAEHEARYRAIREVEARTGNPVGVLVDLQGPKLRLGVVPGEEMAISPGQKLRLGLESEAAGEASLIPLPHPEILAVLKAGSTLLVDDGRVRLEVEACDGKEALVTVIAGHRLSSRKGINIPDIELPIASMTDKDRRDIEYALQAFEVDWVALSFVQRPEDIAELRAVVGDEVAIMAKIEKPSALQRMEEILDLVDGIMVARGDLGVELPPEKIPGVQKTLVQQCRGRGKPVVIATHMMDSMVSAPVPTRAEASDVANAVYEGADAVMLSAETAAGQFPVESVAMMARIIDEVERDPLYKTLLDSARPSHEGTPADAICAALREITRVIASAATVNYTSSGFTSFRVARERPNSPILSLTPSITIARKLTLVWGVCCVLVDAYDDQTSVDALVSQAAAIAQAMGLASRGDYLTVSAGLPLGEPGRTNMLRIVTVK
ncbi:MAG: pyruvate kinase [Gammaproteobacteria bacterium]|nr:pyruvate kinase [Gammaproteobacteria bacterium]